MAGSRLWPPARILASPPLSARRLIASSSVAGATYSNCAGYIPVSPPCDGSGGLAGHFLRGVLDRLDDVLVAGAAAEVALDAAPDLLLARRGIVLEEIDASHDHARRAEAALEPVLLPEAALDRVQLAILRQPLDRLEVGAIGLDRQDRAGLDRVAIHDDGAGAALARV